MGPTPSGFGTLKQLLPNAHSPQGLCNDRLISSICPLDPIVSWPLHFDILLLGIWHLFNLFDEKQIPDRCWPNCLAIYGVFGCLVIYSFRLLWSMNKFWNKGWGAFGQNTVFLGYPVFVVHHRELINILDYKQIPDMAIKYWPVTFDKHQQLNIFLINMLLFTNKESAVGYKQETREHRAGHQSFRGLGLKLGASTWKHK